MARATTPSPSPAFGRIIALLLHGAAALVVGLVLIAVAQPLFTEDMWWHLSMGRAYAAAGPWLEADPNLFTATGPPSPAAWLSSLALHGVERFAGFQGLRITHLVLVCAILGLAWSLLFRASRSRAYASAATALFAVLSAYRLFQLRPDLVSILGAVLLLLIVIAPERAHSSPVARAATTGFANRDLWRRLATAMVLVGTVLGCAQGDQLQTLMIRLIPR